MMKIILLAPSNGGKSTLMRFMRKHTELNILEMDEEVMKENGDKWPADNNYKDLVLVPKIVERILDEDNVLYMASYVPEELLIRARVSRFKVLLLDVSIEELNRRNKQRMTTEDYADASPWLRLQLDTFNKLKDKELIDMVIDGGSSTKDIAAVISNYTVV